MASDSEAAKFLVYKNYEELKIITRWGHWSYFGIKCVFLRGEGGRGARMRKGPNLVRWRPTGTLGCH